MTLWRRETVRDSFIEHHLCGSIDGDRSPEGLLIELAAQLVEHGIAPIQEKLYGQSAIKSAIGELRAECYRRQGLDPKLPYSWIDGAPADGGAFAGLQLWGVSPRAGCTVRTVDNALLGPGRELDGPGYRLLYFPSVRGTLPDGTLASGVGGQADRIFENAERGLLQHGLSYQNVVRTWIYLARLLDGYAELNRVRNAHYARVGFSPSGPFAFPASTGIQGRDGRGSACVMDLLAFQAGPGAIATPILRSSRQDASSSYGSAFSRGTCLVIEGQRTIHVSGTASIDASGASCRVGDAEGQAIETLLSVAALLEAEGSSLEQISMGTLFVKDRSVYQAWQEVTRLLRIPPLPLIAVLAEVCRPELLVELEAVAQAK